MPLTPAAAAVIEEALFRWALPLWLRRLSVPPKLADTVSTALFAAAHWRGGPLAVVHAAVAGTALLLVFRFVHLRAPCLALPSVITIHAVYNLAVYLLVFR